MVRKAGPDNKDYTTPIRREALSFVVRGETDRTNAKVNLAPNWHRIEDLVHQALAGQPEEADPREIEGLTALHGAIKNIADTAETTSPFQEHVNVSQNDIDTLVSKMPFMRVAVRHFSDVIKNGTVFLGATFDEASDRIDFEELENGPAYFARLHLEEIQMFAMRARLKMPDYTTPGLKVDAAPSY